MKVSNTGRLAGIAALLCTFGLMPQQAGATVISTNCAGISFGSNCGLDELLAGGSITINQTLFSNFAITTLFGSRPIAANQIRVDPLDDSSLNPGLTLVDAGGTLRAVDGDFTQSNLTFRVSILPGSNLRIKDNSLAVAIGDVSGGDLSFIDVNENVFASDIFNTFLAHKEVFCDTTTSCANTTGTDQAVFAPGAGVNVSMGIDVSSFDAGDVAEINSLTVRYSQIPLPGSLALLLLGLAGAGSVFRRRLPSRRGVPLFVTALLAFVCVVGAKGAAAYVVPNPVCNATFCEIGPALLDDGTSYGMRVPIKWNGIVLNDLDYVGARTGARSTYWIGRGYAVSGIQRHPNRRYQLDPAGEMVNLLTVLDILEQVFGKPNRVIAFGTSAGGQLGLAFAEKYPDRIHGVVVGGATTPVYTSGVRFDVYQVLKALLAPDSFNDPASALQFLGLPDDSTANVAAWQALFTTASQSPQGLARLALAFTMTQWDQWGATRPDTPDPRNLPAYKLHLRELAIRLHQPHVNTQFLFETQLGVWMGNDGADYQKYWDNADPGFKVAVAQLYQEAGLDLNAEIAQVNAMPRFPMNDSAHHAAYAYWMGDAARTQRGKPNPRIPVFRMHTIGDPQVVASQIQVYNDQIRQNRLTPIYRAAYVEREGHINFTVAEYAAAMEVMMRRLDTGVWPSTSAIGLNQLAQSLNAATGAQGQSRFIEYFYRKFNGDWRLDYPGKSPTPTP